MAIRYIGDANSQNKIRGAADGAAVPAGHVGERVTGTGYNGTALSSGTRAKAADITLNKGVWLVFMCIGAARLTDMTGTRTYAEIASSASGTITYSRADGVAMPTSVADIIYPLSGYVVVSADSTTIYGNVFCVFSGGTGGTTAANIYAVRIA